MPELQKEPDLRAGTSEGRDACPRGRRDSAPPSASAHPRLRAHSGSSHPPPAQPARRTEAEGEWAAQRLATRSPRGGGGRQPRIRSQPSRAEWTVRAWAPRGSAGPPRAAAQRSGRYARAQLPDKPRWQREEGGDPRPVTSPVPSAVWYSRWLHDHGLRAIRRTRARDVGLRPEQGWPGTEGCRQRPRTPGLSLRRTRRRRCKHKCAPARRISNRPISGRPWRRGGASGSTGAVSGGAGLLGNPGKQPEAGRGQRGRKSRDRKSRPFRSDAG